MTKRRIFLKQITMCPVWVSPVVTIISLPVHAQSTPLGDCSITPSTLSFGNVITGTNSIEQATFINSGITTIQLNSVTSDNSNFVPQFSNPVTVEPGESINIDLQFNCSTDDSYSGNVTFQGTASTEAVSCVVSVTGICMPCPAVTPIPGFFVGCPASSFPSNRFNIYYEINDSGPCPVFQRTPFRFDGTTFVIGAAIQSPQNIEYEHNGQIPATGGGNPVIVNAITCPTDATLPSVIIDSPVTGIVNSTPNGVPYTVSYTVTGDANSGLTFSDISAVP